MDSVWAPCLLDEDIQNLLDRNIPPATLSIEKRILPVSCEGSETYLCPFLNHADNKCKVYDVRPFECQLYPFLLSMRNKKVNLTVDLNCPYAAGTIDTKEFKAYAEYLTSYLNSPAQVELLKENPHILQAYEDALDVAELKSPDEF
jgi:Fe-S-cluster containining protein